MLQKVKEWNFKFDKSWKGEFLSGKGLAMAFDNYQLHEFSDEQNWRYLLGTVNTQGAVVKQPSVERRGWVGFYIPEKTVLATFSSDGEHAHEALLYYGATEYIRNKEGIVFSDFPVTFSIQGPGAYAGPDISNIGILLSRGFDPSRHPQGLYDISVAVLSEIHKSIGYLDAPFQLRYREFESEKGSVRIGREITDFYDPEEVNPENRKSTNAFRQLEKEFRQAASMPEDQPPNQLCTALSFPYTGKLHVRHITALNRVLGADLANTTVVFRSQDGNLSKPVELSNLLELISTQPEKIVEITLNVPVRSDELVDLSEKLESSIYRFSTV